MSKPTDIFDDLDALRAPHPFEQKHTLPDGTILSVFEMKELPLHRRCEIVRMYIDEGNKNTWQLRSLAITLDVLATFESELSARPDYADYVEIEREIEADILREIEEEEMRREIEWEEEGIYHCDDDDDDDDEWDAETEEAFQHAMDRND
jgi:hypothetical protein